MSAEHPAAWPHDWLPPCLAVNPAGSPKIRSAAQDRDAELSAPCRCVYPEKCACKPEQKLDG